MNHFDQPDTLKKNFLLFIVYTLGALFTILISLCFIIPKGNEVLWINGNFSPFQDWFFRLVTTLGEGIAFVPILSVLLFVRFHYAFVLAAVGLLNGLIIPLLKYGLFADMKRPITFLDNSLLHFVDGLNVHTAYSFPSGHTATAFAVAVTLSLCIKNKNWSIVFITLAAMVGYSRMYLLQHYLIDVAAGGCIGTCCSILTYKLLPINNIPWINQRLEIKFQIKNQDIQPSGR